MALCTFSCQSVHAYVHTQLLSLAGRNTRGRPSQTNSDPVAVVQLHPSLLQQFYTYSSIHAALLRSTRKKGQRNTKKNSDVKKRFFQEAFFPLLPFLLCLFSKSFPTAEFGSVDSLPWKTFKNTNTYVVNITEIVSAADYLPFRTVVVSLFQPDVE